MALRRPPKAPPLSIGNFELSGKIGAGILGSVYRGREPGTNALVTVHLVSPDLAENAGVIDALRDEFNTAVQFEHPNILRLLDFGNEHGFWYLVTEWVDGITLAQMIQAHTAPARGNGGPNPDPGQPGCGLTRIRSDTRIAPSARSTLSFAMMGLQSSWRSSRPSGTTMLAVWLLSWARARPGQMLSPPTGSWRFRCATLTWRDAVRGHDGNGLGRSGTAAAFQQ